MLPPALLHCTTSCMSTMYPSVQYGHLTDFFPFLRDLIWLHASSQEFVLCRGKDRHARVLLH